VGAGARAGGRSKRRSARASEGRRRQHSGVIIDVIIFAVCDETT
ncbi:MAG: hypothetical protein RI890_1007, partial [Actinomycetota bacterium]